jgi:hypothetical protein
LNPHAVVTRALAGRDEAAFRGQAHVENDWLALTVPIEPLAGPTSPWSVLERNATLPGGVRLVRAAAGGLALRADVPLADDGDERVVTQRIHRAAADLSSAVGGATVVPATNGPLADDVLAASAATGWPIEPRGAAELTVDLGAPDLVERAVVAARADATLAVTVPLVEDPPRGASDISRRAVARLVLRLAGLVRLVRAAADPERPESLRFEVIVAEATSTALAHAFAALAVACGLGAAEIATLLSDEAVARLYLQHPHDAAVPRAA